MYHTAIRGVFFLFPGVGVKFDKVNDRNDGRTSSEKGRVNSGQVDRWTGRFFPGLQHTARMRWMRLVTFVGFLGGSTGSTVEMNMSGVWMGASPNNF